MDDLYIDGECIWCAQLHPADLQSPKALGITEDIERLSLKGSRKKKGRKLDEDFVVSALYSSPGCNESTPNVVSVA
jgi:hypothetical protein